MDLNTMLMHENMEIVMIPTLCRHVVSRALTTMRDRAGGWVRMLLEGCAQMY